MSKSKKWRNGRKKRSVSPEEKERREALRQKCLERQREQKRRDRIEFMKLAVVPACFMLLFIAAMILDIVFDSDFLGRYLLCGWVLAIFIFDSSGIRSFVFRHYPDRLPLAELLKSDDTPNRRMIELCRTVSFLAVWAMLFVRQLQYVWTLVWILSMLTAFGYILFDEKTVLLRESRARKDDLTSASVILLFTSPVLFLFLYRNTFFTPGIGVFVLAFTAVVTGLYLVVAARKISGVRLGELGVFVIGAAAFAFMGVVQVNRAFDFSEPATYTVAVEDMYFYVGKNSSYTIYVENWTGEDGTVSVDVSSNVYHTIAVGDEVIISEHSGALGIRYYVYSGKAESENQ